MSATRTIDMNGICQPMSSSHDTTTASRSLFLRRHVSRVVVSIAVSVFALACAGTATAASALDLQSSHEPAVIPAGGEAVYKLAVSNSGDAPTSAPLDLTLEVPAGLQVKSVTDEVNESFGIALWACAIAPDSRAVTCSGPDFGGPLPTGPGEEACVSAVGVTCRLLVTVTADAGAQPGVLAPTIGVCGGGATSCETAADPITVREPGFGIEALDGGVFDEAGNSYTQAGGHPDTASLTLELNKVVQDGGYDIDGGQLRSARVALPAGLIGNPTAMPQCSRALSIPSSKQNSSFEPNLACPTNSVVGFVTIKSISQGGIPGPVSAPLFNLQPAPGIAAQFGFNIDEQTTILSARVRTDSDYGVTITAQNASQAKPVAGSTVTLWGDPADQSHDEQRCLLYDTNTDHCFLDPSVRLTKPWNAPNAAGLLPRALVTNPSACTPSGVGLETRVTVESWSSPAASDSASFMSHLSPGLPLPVDQWGPPQGPTGCEAVPFEASLSVAADSRRADSPASLSVELGFPQEGLENPRGIANGHLKRARVTLPEGWSVSPSSADGLVGCSDAQSSIGTLLGAQCPEASKIGTVTASTPLLDETLSGGVYVGTQESDDPLSGRMFRMFIALNSEERGIRVKLPGEIRIDPATGKITTTFDNNPQVPVSKIRLALKAGPRAPLATPADCGSKTVLAELKSWSGAEITRTDDLIVDCPGAQGLAPSFDAGSASSAAGRFSPLLVRIERPDGQEFIDGLDLQLPKGVLAKLAGVPLCPDAAASAGTCGAGSRVGSATVGAGPGSNPLYLLDQPVYLAGPYKGAPYSLSVVTHAKAGPFDLGLVVVRQALHVDRQTAQVTVKSDPVPTIVKGVPIRLRSVAVDIDRPAFALNPTSCASKEIGAVFHSQQGSTSATSARLGVHDCSLLRFAPKLKLSLTGRGQVRTGKHPGVNAVVRQTGVGEAGIAKARVELPKSLALDPDNARALCEFEDGTKPDLENHCPKGSIVGRARALTPLLDRPLAGNVYFVKNVRRSASGNLIRTLPMIVVALRGQIAINLEGKSSTTRDGKLVNTFASVPDAPITRFALNVNGGRNGILAVTRTRRAKINLCARPKSHLAQVEMDGQNSKRADFRTRVKTPCAARKAGKRSSGR